MLDENEMKEEKDYFFPETLILETASTSASKMVTNTSPKGNADTSKVNKMRNFNLEKNFSCSFALQGVETSKRHINIHDKRVLCPFCDQEITNFSRHLLRKHKNEEEVKQIASYEKLSKERLSLIELLRKRGNFIDLARGNIRPVKRPKDHADLAEYSACLYCHGLYKKKFIYKHSKKCKFNKGSCL